MAETYIIRIDDIPSKKIRKNVQSFLEGHDVSIVGEDGQSLEVILEKNQLVVARDK